MFLVKFLNRFFLRSCSTFLFQQVSVQRLHSQLRSSRTALNQVKLTLKQIINQSDYVSGCDFAEITQNPFSSTEKDVWRVSRVRMREPISWGYSWLESWKVRPLRLFYVYWDFQLLGAQQKLRRPGWLIKADKMGFEPWRQLYGSLNRSDSCRSLVSPLSSDAAALILRFETLINA